MNPVLLQHSEWLIQPEALRSMAVEAASYRGGPLLQPDSPNSLLSVEDGIATISIEGPILRKPGLFARVIMGATDSEEIGAAIREANDRTDIKAVMLNIDSPGGTVAGTPELANAVASLNEQKPVYAFSSGLMASATSNTALAAALSALGIPLAEKPFVRVVGDGIRGERVVWFFEPQSADGIYQTKTLIEAWNDDAWHLSHPEHPFAYIKAALMNREALVTKIKQDVPLACISRRGKFAFLPLNASPKTEDLFLRYL